MTNNKMGYQKCESRRRPETTEWERDREDSRGAHNVVTNNKMGYQKCTTSRGAKVYKSGKDQIISYVITLLVIVY